ncbi:MAG: MnhB domain-containing protein [Nanoarchaeota archaeon]
MDTIVKTTAKILFPFILVFGAYVTMHGHLTPGGGFPGGAIIATGFTLLIIAFKEGRVEHVFHEVSFIDAKSIAALGLVLILMFGIFIRLEFIEMQKLMDMLGGGITLPSNILGTVMVATALVIIVYSIIKE